MDQAHRASPTPSQQHLCMCGAIWRASLPDMMEFDLKSKGQHRLVRPQAGTAWWMALHSLPHSGTHRVSSRVNGEARGKLHRKGHFSPLLSFYSVCYTIKMHILRTAWSTQLKSLNIHSDTEERASQMWELKEQRFRVGNDCIVFWKRRNHLIWRSAFFH